MISRATAVDRSRPTAVHVAVPGDGLLHPVVLMAIGILLVNDHVLKSAWPGAVTGKLSDIAGLVFFPLLLQAVWELAAAAVGRRHLASRMVLLIAVVVTAVVFSAVQLVPLAAQAYSVGLGVAQWAIGSVPIATLGGGFGHPVPVAVTPDATDLLALPAVLVPLSVGLGRSRRLSQSSTATRT